MADPKSELLSNAPLIDFEELKDVILMELLSRETRSKADSVWISGSFPDPEREIDRTDTPSDLDLFVLVPEWDLPPVDTGIPLLAPEAETPSVYQNVEKEAIWDAKETPLSAWDCSPQAAWDRLPNHARETLMRSVKKGFYATEGDVEAERLRGYDLSIGNEEHFEHGRCPRADIRIWNGESKFVSYNGADVCVNPSDRVGEALYTDGEYEPDVRRAIERILEPGDTAVDIGAHTGHHSATMRQRIGASGELFLFEPHPKNHDRLERTIRKNGWRNVHLSNAALSDECGAGVLVERRGATNTGASSLTRYAPESGPEYEVETVRLSDRLSEIAGPELIKIDAEGSEAEIIDDIGDRLSRIDHILLEVHVAKLPEKGLSRLYETLSAAGEIETLDGEPIRDIEQMKRSYRHQIVWARSP